MRAYLVSLIVFCQAISQQKPIKTFYSKDNNSLYSFYKKDITVMKLHGGAPQDIKLHPIPEGYPDYNPIWYKNQLHLLSQRGGLLYRVENDSTIRLDKSFQHHKQFQSNDFVYRDTLFRYGGYGFWRANNFFTYFDSTTKEWEYYPTRGFTMPNESYDGTTFLLDDTFYVLGGQTVNKSTGLSGEKSNQIWTFDFLTREWSNRGKMGLDIGSYKSVQKDSLFFLIGNPMNTSGDIILDIKNNTAKHYEHTLVSANTKQQAPAFFTDDTLHYIYKDELLQALIFRDIFSKEIKKDRLFLNEITLFWNITYLGIAGVFLFLLAYGSVIWQRRKLPRLVKGGIRHNLTFYPLSTEEQQVINLLRQNLSVSTDELIPIFSKQKRSFSQTHKLKADAIDNINNLLNTLVGKDLIKKKKDPRDKRQLVYYYKRNTLH